MMTQLENTLGPARKLCLVAKKAAIKASKHDPADGVLLDFMSRDSLAQILQQLLQHLVQSPSSKELLVSANLLISDILYFQPLETLTQQILNQCMAVATSPWMDGEVKFLDLKLAERIFKGLAAGANGAARSQFDTEVHRSILYTVSSVQKEVAPQWRMHVLRKAWSLANNADVRCQIILHMPVILHCFGPNALPLVKEMTENVLTEGKPDEVFSLSKVAGQLVCVLSRQSVLTKVDGSVNLACVKCESLPQQRKVSQVSSEDIEFILKIIGFPDSKVKEEIVSLIKPLSNHVGFNQSSVSLWLNYFQEESFIRLCPYVKYFLAPANLTEEEFEDDIYSLPSIIASQPGWQDHQSVVQYIVTCLNDICQTVQRGESSKEFVEMVCKFLADLAGSELRVIVNSVTEMMVELMLCPISHIQMFAFGQSYLKQMSDCERDSMITKIAEILARSSNFKETLDFATVMCNYSTSKKFVLGSLSVLLPPLVYIVCTQKDLKLNPIEELAQV